MKQKAITFTLGIIMLACAHAQSTDQELIALMNNQLEAFNNQDIKVLTANVHPDFKWFYITPDTTVLEVSGKESFKEGMISYYQSVANVHSEVTDFVVDGNRISFREKVSWQNSKGEFSQSALGVYEIRQNKIFRAWYFMD